VGIGFPAQQCVWIDTGAVGLVAELDAAKVTLGPLLAGHWCSITLVRALGRWRPIVLAVDPLERGMERPGLQQDAIH